MLSKYTDIHNGRRQGKLIIVGFSLISLHKVTMSKSTEIRVPDLAPHNLMQGLEIVEREQQEATPPPKFRNQSPDQCYDYLCEVEHSKRSPVEINDLCMSINDPLY